MNNPRTPKPPRRRRDPLRGNPRRAQACLEELIASLAPGDAIPTHTLLMDKFKVSERAIRTALDELQRRGRIHRRNGSGTFVAEQSPETSHIVPSGGTANRSIIAIAKPDQSFFDRCLDVLHQRVQTAGLSLIYRVADPDIDTRFASPIPEDRPLGYLLFRYAFAPLAKQLQDSGCRVVLVGAPSVDSEPEFPCVYSDHQAGGYLATKYLLDLGHRRLVFFNNDSTDITKTLRWQGFDRAIADAKRAGLPVSSTEPLIDRISTWNHEPQLAAEYFRRPDAPTAVVAWNDHHAMALMTILRRAGVRIPEDVSIIGYDNLPASELIMPALTTIDHGIEAQVQSAVELLISDKPLSGARTTVFMPTLIKRGSCSPPQSYS